MWLCDRHNSTVSSCTLLPHSVVPRPRTRAAALLYETCFQPKSAAHGTYIATRKPSKISKEYLTARVKYSGYSTRYFAEVIIGFKGKYYR